MFMKALEADQSKGGDTMRQALINHSFQGILQGLA
jgi:hypothetical protein